ncbi:hypothetical protein ES707_15852 [subsurface metagenome]
MIENHPGKPEGSIKGLNAGALIPLNDKNKVHKKFQKSQSIFWITCLEKKINGCKEAITKKLLLCQVKLMMN